MSAWQDRLKGIRDVSPAVSEYDVTRVEHYRQKFEGAQITQITLQQIDYEVLKLVREVDETQDKQEALEYLVGYRRQVSNYLLHGIVP